MMDHSIRRRVANDDLTPDEAEDLEWELAEKNGEDPSPAPVVGTGFHTVSDQEHANSMSKSLVRFARSRVDMASVTTKSLTSLQTSLGTFPEKKDQNLPFDWYKHEIQ